MSKITTKITSGRIIITNKFTYPEVLYERELNVSSSLGAFLPVIVKKSGKTTVLECIVQGLNPVSHNNGYSVNKTYFLKVVDQLINIIKKCEDLGLSSNHIDLDPDRIFLDPQGTVRCILWPVLNNYNYEEKGLFFHQLPGFFSFIPGENMGFLNSYYAFFSSGAPFSINNFQRLIKYLMGRKEEYSYQAPSDQLREKPKDQKSRETPQGIEYNPFDEKRRIKIIEEKRRTLFCMYCGTKNTIESSYCSFCGKPLVKPNGVNGGRTAGGVSDKGAAQTPAETPAPSPVQTRNQVPTPVRDQIDPDPAAGQAPPSGTVVLGYNERRGTVVLGCDELPAPAYPYLIREKSREKIPVDKPVFRIGSEREYCDYFVSDNSYVSRSHADIVTRGNHFYVVDKNSTNKTYVDGRVIKRETEVEVFSGSEILLANEKFTFYVE